MSTKLLFVLILFYLPPSVTAASLLILEKEPLFGLAKLQTRWSVSGVTIYQACQSPTIDPLECLAKFQNSTSLEKILLADSATGQQILVNSNNKLSLKRIFIAATKKFEHLQEIPRIKKSSPVSIFVDPNLDKEIAISARRFVSELQQTGFDATLVVLPAFQKDVFNIDRERSVFIDTLNILMGQPRTSLASSFRNIVQQSYRWQKPLLSNDDWQAHPEFLDTRTMDSPLLQTLKLFHQGNSHLWQPYSLASYTSFSLTRYRQYLAENNKSSVHSLRYIKLNSHWGNQLVLDWEIYGKYDPVIVVAVDDENNLFRSPEFYQTVRQYSWKKTPRPKVSVRPLGAFLYFRKPIPRNLQLTLNKRSALKFTDLEFFADNPWQVLDSLPSDIKSTISRNCIHCHQTGGIGGRQGHLVAETGELQGGFALPLESYPDEVMREFLFNQKAVARKIGVTPNLLPLDKARALYQWHQSVSH